MKIYPNGYRFLSCSHFYTISGIKVGVFLLYLYLNGYNMGNQTIVKYVTQMRREEGVQKRILSFLFPENVILITFYE